MTALIHIHCWDQTERCTLKEFLLLLFSVRNFRVSFPLCSCQAPAIQEAAYQQIIHRVMNVCKSETWSRLQTPR